METRNRAGAIRIILLTVPSEWETIRQRRSVSLPYRFVLAVAYEDNEPREITNPIPPNRKGATMWTSKHNCRQDSNPCDAIVDGKGSRRIKAIRAARRCQAIELLDRQSVEPSSACWSLC